MTVYISPNPGKLSASEVALRAAQILQNHGASVLMRGLPAGRVHGRRCSICRWNSVWNVRT